MAEENEELQRVITFEWNGTMYTLEYNRESLNVLEKRFGVNIAKLVSGAEVRITDLPNMFMAATMMHHPNMKTDTVKTLFDLMPDKFELFAALSGMIGAAAMDVFEEPEEGKAISWSRQ